MNGSQKKIIERLMKGKKPTLVFYPTQLNGDNTCDFDVKFSVMYVKDVVRYILTQNEQGVIAIRSRGVTSEYAYLKTDLGGTIPFELMEKKVKKITAHGGWGKMNYLIQ